MSIGSVFFFIGIVEKETFFCSCEKTSNYLFGDPRYLFLTKCSVCCLSFPSYLFDKLGNLKPYFSSTYSRQLIDQLSTNFSLRKVQGLIYCPFIIQILTYTNIKSNLMIDNQLPPNIRTFIKHNQSRLSGSKIAITKFTMSLEDFQASRINSKELARIRINHHRFKDNIQSNQIYQIHVQGRKNTYYEGKVIPFFMFIFDQYPLEPPQIMVPYLFSHKEQKFIQFLHLNIDNIGHVCMLLNQKDKQYYGKTTLKELLFELQKTIYQPNIQSAYQNPLFDAYKNDQDSSSYYKILNQQADLLPNNDLYSEDEQSSEEESDNQN